MHYIKTTGGLSAAPKTRACAEEGVRGRGGDAGVVAGGLEDLGRNDGGGHEGSERPAQVELAPVGGGASHGPAMAIRSDGR